MGLESRRWQAVRVAPKSIGAELTGLVHAQHRSPLVSAHLPLLLAGRLGARGKSLPDNSEDRMAVRGVGARACARDPPSMRRTLPKGSSLPS